METSSDSCWRSVELTTNMLHFGIPTSETNCKELKWKHQLKYKCLKEFKIQLNYK